MTKRRFPALLLAVAMVVAVIAAVRQPTDARTPTFSVSVAGWMPAAPTTVGLTETWFCPGVPATGVDGIGGEIVIANRTAELMLGSVLVVNDQNASTRLELAVSGWSAATVDLAATLPGTMVGAVVEIDGGGAVVEQRSTHPQGSSASACANSTSDVWYLADGFTVEGSLDQIVLTNPYDQTIVADLTFATREGSRAPSAYSGMPIAPRSIKVVDLGAPGAGAQGEPILAVTVAATRGRLVVGRFQQFLGAGRSGSQVTLASPAAREQWWFANGVKGAGVTEQFSIYNPTDEDVEVDAVFLGITTELDVAPIQLPAHQVTVFDPATVDGLPEGRHAVVFFESFGEPRIVVERVTTETVGDQTSTSVLAGATSRPDGYYASTWHLASGPESPTEDALVVYNADNTAGTVSVFAVGSSGPVPLVGLQDMVLPGASIIAIDLVDPLALGRELVVSSTSRIFVEQSFPNGRGDTRTASWAIPAN